MLAIFAFTLALGQTPQASAISAARNSIVRDMEKTLPAVKFEAWLQELVGRQTALEWGVTDCGEQTGDPATDRARDIPVCAEVNVKLPGDRLLSLSLLAGSRQRGLTVGSLTFSSGAIIEPKPKPITWIKTLAELPKLIGYR
jgi:hypothetical protein